MSRLLPLSLALLLALGGIGSARAQSAPGVDKAVLPVWNNASGKVEAVLVLEPTSAAEAGGRFRFGNNSLDATFGLDAGDSLALLCDRKTGIATVIVDKNHGAVTSICDRAMILVKGQIVFDGTSAEVQNNPTLIQTHLGV